MTHNTNMHGTALTSLVLVWIGLTGCRLAAEICTAPADVCLVLDESGSISAPEFELVLNFAVSILQNITISTTDTRVALVTYSSSARAHFHLNGYTNNSDVISAVSNLHRVRGRTYTGAALDLMDTTMFTPANGDRSSVPNIGILVTDGYSTNPSNTIRQAAQARAHGIFLFAIGVSRARQTELQAIATDPDEMYVFNIRDFNYLTNVASKIIPKACAVAETRGNLVGKACTNDSDCPMANSKCSVSQTCQCSPGHFVYDYGALACRLRRLLDGCASNGDCSPVANATCIMNEECGCAPPFVAHAGSCHECALGAACPAGIDCGLDVHNSRCAAGLLRCAPGWTPTGGGAICRRMVLGTDSCGALAGADCTSGAICDQVTGTCACGPAYLLAGAGTQCVSRALGATCSFTAMCDGRAGGVCTAGRCACAPAYIRQVGDCRPRLLGEAGCELASDCAGIAGEAVCDVSNSTCQCAQGHLPSGATSCIPRPLGAACHTTADCGLSLSVCLQGACACKPGIQQDNSACVAVGASSSGPSAGAVMGGVLGTLGALAIGVGATLGAIKFYGNAMVFSKALEARQAQTQMTSQSVEKLFPGMTPGCSTSVCSPAPCSTNFVNLDFAR